MTLLRCKYNKDTAKLNKISVAMTCISTFPYRCGFVKSIGIWRKKNKKLAKKTELSTLFESLYSRLRTNPLERISSEKLEANAMMQ